MKRREFITLVGGAAAWPLVSRAQNNRLRRVGMLMNLSADDIEATARIVAFVQELQRLGWTVGHNLQIEYRWGAGDADKFRKYAAELAMLAPDVIVTSGAGTVAALLQATSSVPIVFALVADPVGAGFVDSLAQPGRNATGFTALEYSLGGKWLELLKEIAPNVTRAAVIRDPTDSAGIGLFSAVQSAAAPAGVELTAVNVRNVDAMARALGAFASPGPNGGLILTASAIAFVHRDAIVAQAARHKLPAVYFSRPFVAAGGLACYGVDTVNQYRQAASYVDRILKGEKPGDLPVQAPTKYELVINLKTAKALGLTIPPTVLARAAEVIE
jgi:putative ABC transport system substrate-binding protein